MAFDFMQKWFISFTLLLFFSIENSIKILSISKKLKYKINWNKEKELEENVFKLKIVQIKGQPNDSPIFIEFLLKIYFRIIYLFIAIFSLFVRFE